jgi:hypothetical protein
MGMLYVKGNPEYCDHILISYHGHDYTYEYLYSYVNTGIFFIFFQQRSKAKQSPGKEAKCTINKLWFLI